MFRDLKVYVWGVVMGFVVIFAFATVSPVGSATTYERVTGHIIEFFSPEYVYRTVHYYQKAVPVADWQTMFVIGMLLAGILGRHLTKRSSSPHKAQESVPAMWAGYFGTDTRKRYIAAFIGGMLLLFGARLAHGCTSGHFISGGSQLALSAYVFALSMFVAGIITAKVLYRKQVA